MKKIFILFLFTFLITFVACNNEVGKDSEMDDISTYIPFLENTLMIYENEG